MHFGERNTKSRFSSLSNSRTRGIINLLSKLIWPNPLIRQKNVLCTLHASLQCRYDTVRKNAILQTNAGLLCRLDTRLVHLRYSDDLMLFAESCQKLLSMVCNIMSKTLRASAAYVLLLLVGFHVKMVKAGKMYIMLQTNGYMNVRMNDKMTAQPLVTMENMKDALF